MITDEMVEAARLVFHKTHMDVSSQIRAMLEAAEALRPVVVGVPEGWQLVPKEPTEDMIEAADVTTTIYNDFCEADLIDIFKAMLQGAPEPPALVAQTAEPVHPDDIAVDRFAAAMKVKLAKKRKEGSGGWEDKKRCSIEFLSRLLREHVEKGDAVDVGNLAMMIHQRGERVIPPVQEAQEPVAIYRGNGLTDCGDAGHHNIELLKLIPANTKLYAAPQPAEPDALREGNAAEEQRLHEIADGAWGDDPATRGRARDELKRRAALKGDAS